MSTKRESWTIGSPESYHPKEEVYFVRMNMHERVQHHLVWTTFIILAVTGFMVESPNHGWFFLIPTAKRSFTGADCSTA